MDMNQPNNPRGGGYITLQHINYKPNKANSPVHCTFKLHTEQGQEMLLACTVPDIHAFVEALDEKGWLGKPGNNSITLGVGGTGTRGGSGVERSNIEQFLTRRAA